jgi:hypothetical protein
MKEIVERWEKVSERWGLSRERGKVLSFGF